jgi:hypothetical protein
MTMTPRLSKFALTAHIVFSVGWIGAVAGFLVLSIAGLTSKDTEVVRGAYLAMNLIGLYIIVPLSLAALLTGLIQSLGTNWGLFRHYWVLVKFLLTIFAIIALLMHQFSAVRQAASLVSQAAGGMRGAALAQVGTQLVGVASVAIVLLLVLTTLSVYKPWGLTNYGRRMQEQERRKVLPQLDNGTPFGLKVFLTVIGVLVAMFVLMHLTGHSLHHGH